LLYSLKGKIEEKLNKIRIDIEVEIWLNLRDVKEVEVIIFCKCLMWGVGKAAD
jgi:hypothetical protein